LSKLDIDDTGVGSYFIANYPPFSFWKPEELRAAEQALCVYDDETPTPW
jgi:hypothetical protein